MGIIDTANNKFDICVIGHLTEDRITIEGQKSWTAPGGVTFYAALTYARLGLQIAIVTKLTERDKSRLLKPLQDNNLEVFAIESPTTTCFENIYLNATLQARRQQIRALAAPFQPEDIRGINATAYHFGPLTGEEMPLDWWQRVTNPKRLIALDVQGLTRRVVGNHVHDYNWLDKNKQLTQVDILKADTQEATILTGVSEPTYAAWELASYGPKEVLVTQGAQGSIILAEGRMHQLPAYPPSSLNDSTGCGDTYLAAYVTCRLQNEPPSQAGRFAAVVASLKLAQEGPFQGNISTIKH